jgi:hypothetical protein
MKTFAPLFTIPTKSERSERLCVRVYYVTRCTKSRSIRDFGLCQKTFAANKVSNEENGTQYRIPKSADGEGRLIKRCVVCNVRYHGWPESDYCSNECASEGHRICENPSKDRITFLRAQCRASWERSIRANGAESFETWLRNFEARLERMPPPNQNQQPMKSQKTLV